jgi:hypothetical protein
MEIGDRLRCLRMTTLETRRMRADLTEVYRIMNGIDKLNEEDFFSRYGKLRQENSGRTRGHALKLYKKRFCGDKGKFSIWKKG